ncbi:MAG: hypothetical protein C0404_10270 [Verrucomicrobia bacterium]|nr:hypothetical protein [Verrucomicrobiota bacterium]
MRVPPSPKGYGGRVRVQGSGPPLARGPEGARDGNIGFRCLVSGFRKEKRQSGNVFCPDTRNPTPETWILNSSSFGPVGQRWD